MDEADDEFAAEMRRLGAAKPELVAEDLRTVCLREQAHAVIGMTFEIKGKVKIMPTTHGPDFYCGNYKPLATIRDAHARRMIGLAGWLAQLRARSYDVTASEAWQAYKNGDAAELSDDDRKMAEGFTENDVSECYRLVRDNWSAIISAAAYCVANPDVFRTYRRPVASRLGRSTPSEWAFLM